MSKIHVTPDGALHEQIVLGIVHAKCSTFNIERIYSDFFSEIAEQNPWGRQPLVSKADWCRYCNKKFVAKDIVALVPILA